MITRPTRKLAAVTLSGLMVAVLLAGDPARAQTPPFPQKEFTDTPSHKVIRVVDGDTAILNLDGKEVSVRLIGVDTPETVHPQKPVEAYGQEAKRFTENLLKGEQVYLEYEPGPSRLDAYGRTLAYLYRAPDGLFVNLEIVRQGYGHAYTKYPFQYMELFSFYQQRARETQKGLWAPDVAQEAGSSEERQGPSVWVSKTGARHYHRPNCPELAADKVVMSLSDAKSQGYSVCPVCVSLQTLQERQKATSDDGRSSTDAQSQDVTVYVTRTGSKYHRGSCSYLRQSRIPMGLSEAQARYGPCSRCNPPTLSSANVSSPTPSISGDGRCTAITKKGTRCKRNARSGGRCWQHGG